MRDRIQRGDGAGSDHGGSGSAAGKRTLTQRRAIQRRAIQRRGDAPVAEPATVTELASAGVAGAGGPLPYVDQIAASFGPGHDLSNVRAHTDASAARAATDIGAIAYATGDDVAFASAPSLHTAAHEAAHVVQQRAGVHLKSDVGEVDDPYERNADAVADRVVAGLPADDLLPAGGGGGGGVQRQVVQRYAAVTGQLYDKLSDDGKLAVIDHGKVGWAEPSMITAANAALATNHSKAKVEPTGTGDITVAPPGAVGAAPKTTLNQFKLVDRATSTELSLTDDCGSATQQVLGAEHHGSTEFVAAHKNGTTQEFTGAESYHGDDNAAGGVVSTTEVLSGQIYVRIFAREFKKTLSRTDALAEWAKLDQKEKDRLSQKYGINQFAVPKMGQSVTIGSERDMPGATPGGYNFHFAYNLMASGADYLTLEDYDSSGVKYYLNMFGPASKQQSFAEDPGNTGALGNLTTTMVVTHPDNLVGTVNKAGTQLVDDPKTWANSRVLALGDKVTIQRRGDNWMKVTVDSGAQAGQVGWILNAAFTQS